MKCKVCSDLCFVLQQAALHALGNISGETRSGNNIILNGDAEESLRRLIYEASSKTSKLTPSVSQLSFNSFAVFICLYYSNVAVL